MKKKRLLEVILFALIVFSLCSCSKNTAKNECESTSRSTYSFDAHIEIDNTLVGYDETITVKSKDLSSRIVVQTLDESYKLGLMVFNNNKPIMFNVDKQEYSYYTFTAGKNSWVDIEIASSDLVEGVSKISVVLLTNEGYYPEFNRDDLKNYSMTMDYMINNISDTSISNTKLNEPTYVEHISLTDYFNVCKDNYVKAYPEMKRYDFTYEEQCLYNLVNNDLDMVFTEDFNLDDYNTLSVYRYTSQYPNSNKTMDLRITGEPGTYYVTIFCDGTKYNGFDGAETIAINLAENEMVVVPVSLPPFADKSYSNVFALAFKADNTEHRVYDSAILTTFFTQNEIDLYSNHVQTYYNIFYEGELLTERTLQVQEPEMHFRFIMNQNVSSFYNDYTLMILVDGIPMEYTVGEEKYLTYDFSCTYGVVDLEIKISPEPASRKESFVIDFVLKQKYSQNSFSLPRFQTSAVKKISFECRFGENANSEPDTERLELDPIYAELKIDNLSNFSSNSVLNALLEAETYTIEATVYNSPPEYVLNHCLLVNNNVIYIDDKYEYDYSTDNEYSFKVKVPKEYLYYGMNEVHLISTRDIDNVSFETIKLVYRSNSEEHSKINYENDVFLIPCDEGNLYTSVYINSGSEGNSHFVAMFGSITTRNICNGKGDVSDIQINMGDPNKDDRFLIKMIISSIKYKNKKYSYSQNQYIGGTY